MLVIYKRLPWIAITLLIVAFGNRLFAAASLESASPLNSATKTTSQSAHLSAVPTSCVALHKGQLCYQRIQLSWTNTDGNRYCLFSQISDNALHCSDDEETLYLHDYASKTSETYSLRQGNEGPIVSTITVSTSWVYRTGRRSSSGWRLF